MATTNQSEHDQLVRYLLGQLPPEGRAAIEVQYLQDASFLERLELVESELIESYLEDGLSREQKIQFEHQYLANPERRLRVATVTLLVKRFRKRSRFAVSQVVRYGLAAIVVLTVAAFAVYYPGQTPGAIILRAGGGQRGLGQHEQRITMTRDVPSLRLRLDVRQVDSKRIDHAVLRTIEDESPAWYQKITQPPDQAVLEIIIQGSVLEDRDYILMLESTSQTLASYSFRVQRK